MSDEKALIPISDLTIMANTMAKSGMFGKNPDQMLSLMLIAQAESLHPAIAAMEYDIIQGRPALKGQAALARFQQAGGKIEWVVRTDSEARAIFSHPQGGSLSVSWTMERARKMNLDGKDNWKKQPGVMLSWRCVAEGVRAVYPACLNRMYLSEEVQDFEPMRDVSPARNPEEVVKVFAAHDANDADDRARDEIQAKRSRATELQRSIGLKKEEASEIYESCGKDIDSYISKLESMQNTGDDFQLTSDPDPVDLGELLAELNDIAKDAKTPATCRNEIDAALSRDESDIGKLTALLEKARAAIK